MTPISYVGELPGVATIRDTPILMGWGAIRSIPVVIPNQLGSVDLERGSLRVVESLEQTKAGIRFKAPRTDRMRAITLPAFAVDELRRLKRQ